MIFGKRVRLRALNQEDLPLFVEWLNDPEVVRGLTHYQPFSLEDEKDWYEGMRKMPQEERPLMVDVRIDTKWKPIGDLGLFGIDWRIRSAEFGIVIGEKAYWDQGYGTEAMELILKHGFETLNLNRIYLRVYEDNLRAIRVYKKTGFKQEGNLRQAHFQDGSYMDVILMSILRSDWDQSDVKRRMGDTHVR